MAKKSEQPAEQAAPQPNKTPPKLQEAVDWVKAALGRKKGLIEVAGFYRIGDGQVMAYDGNFAAGHPVDAKLNVLAAGDALEDALGAFGEGELRLKVEDGKLVVESGKNSKAVVDTLPFDAWGTKPPTEEGWMPAPPGLKDALEMVKGFVPSNPRQPWQGGVMVTTKHATAASFAALARAKLDNTEEIPSVIIPPYACDFVVSSGQPDEWQVTEGFAAFRWSSGAWMKTQLITGEPPEILDTIIAKCGEATSEVTNELRDALLRAMSVTDAAEAISVYADRVQGGRKRLNLTAWAGAPVPKGQESSAWTKEFLEPVLALATHINFQGWPDAVAWKGERAFGVMMGRRA